MFAIGKSIPKHNIIMKKQYMWGDLKRIKDNFRKLYKTNENTNPQIDLFIPYLFIEHEF